MNKAQQGNVLPHDAKAAIQRMAEKAKLAELVNTDRGIALLIDGNVIEVEGGRSHFWTEVIHAALRMEWAPPREEVKVPEVDEHPAPKVFTGGVEYLTSKQVQRRYQISEMTLFRWCKTETLGFPKAVRVNRRKYFDVKDLEQWESSRLNQSDRLPSPPRKATPSPKTICEEILSEQFPGITWEDVIGKRRGGYLISARHACMYAVYKSRKDLSFPDLGRIFNKDHTSVLHAIKKIEAEQQQ